jgi:putative DNA primase/helicase
VVKVAEMDVTSRFVFLVEGEKDADNLAALGLTATCNPGGAGKWRPEYTEQMRGLDVVIVPDNDEPGELHAWKVARELRGVAKSVCVLSLPGLPPKGDVSDYLRSGGTAEELVKLAEAAPIRAARDALLSAYYSPDVAAALRALESI